MIYSLVWHKATHVCETQAHISILVLLVFCIYKALVSNKIIQLALHGEVAGLFTKLNY